MFEIFTNWFLQILEGGGHCNHFMSSSSPDHKGPKAADHCWRDASNRLMHSHLLADCRSAQEDCRRIQLGGQWTLKMLLILYYLYSTLPFLSSRHSSPQLGTIKVLRELALISGAEKQHLRLKLCPGLLCCPCCFQVSMWAIAASCACSIVVPLPVWIQVTGKVHWWRATVSCYFGWTLFPSY